MSEAADVEAKITQKTAELQAVETDTKGAKVRRGQAERRLKETQAKYARQEEDFATREKELKTQLEEIAAVIKEAKQDGATRQATIQGDIDALQIELKEAKAELSERKAYLKEQERVIHSTLEDGEARIADLDYQVKQILKQQQETLQETAEIAHTRDSLEVEVQQEMDKKQRLEDIYSEAAARYKKALKDLYLKLEQNTEAYNQQVTKGKQLATRLSAKERELDARTESIDVQEEKLAQERRFLESRKHLYT